MSVLYTRLCKAIAEQNTKDLNEIRDLCCENPLSTEVRELCVRVYKEERNFLKLLYSRFSVEESEDFLQFMSRIRLMQQEQEMIYAYRVKFEHTLQVYRMNDHKRFTQITQELIRLNSSFFTTPSILFKAFTECFTLALNLPMNNRVDYYKNMVTLAFNLFHQYPTDITAPGTPLDIFGMMLKNFRLNQFSIDNLAEILSIQPVRHLTAIFNLYVELKGMVSKEEFQRLIIRVKWQDWPYLYKSPFSLHEKNILIYHLRNYGMDSLVGRAYTLLCKQGDDSFEKANQDPLAIIHKYEPVVQASSQSLPGTAPSLVINQSFFYASALSTSSANSVQVHLINIEGRPSNASTL